jgi:hypothetical protein
MQAVAATAKNDKGTIPKDTDQFVVLSTPKSVSGACEGRLVPATGIGSCSSGKEVSVEGAQFARTFQDERHDEKGEGKTRVFDHLSKRAMPAM